MCYAGEEGEDGVQGKIGINDVGLAGLCSDECKGDGKCACGSTATNLAASIQEDANEMPYAEESEKKMYVSIIGGHAGSGKSTIAVAAAQLCSRQGCKTVMLTQNQKEDIADMLGEDPMFPVNKMDILARHNATYFTKINHVFVDIGRNLSPKERADILEKFEEGTYITIVV